MTAKKQGSGKQVVPPTTQKKLTKRVTRLLADRVLTEAKNTAGPKATEEQLLTAAEKVMADVLERLFPPRGAIVVPLRGSKGSLDMHENVSRLQAKLIKEALRQTDGDRELAAKLLGLSTNQLRTKMQYLHDYLH